MAAAEAFSRPSPALNYVVSASKPTAVTHSLVGNFVDEGSRSLVLGKGTRLEVSRLTAEGLQGVADVPVYGRIAALAWVRPRGARKDLLFLLTEGGKFALLEWVGGELVTRAAGDASERVGRPTECGQLVAVDPDARLIALHLYDGALTVIPVGEGGALGEAFSVRLEELKVLDVAFLHGCAEPTLAVLWEDTREARHAKTYTVSLAQRDLLDGPWAHANLGAGAALAIPVRGTSGAVFVGEAAATFLSAEPPCSAALRQPTLVRACGEVGDSGTRFLLGDYMGNLYLMVLAKEALLGAVSGIKLEPLGRTSLASTLAYLDSGVVFVGSTYGDSQLIRLHATPPDAAQPDNYVEVLDTIPNLGPIVDFAVMDLERQGQGQVVTCSGASVDGSLRIVRNGIGVVEQASVELPGIKGIWSLRGAEAATSDAYLVLAFVGETRVLGLNTDDELDEAEISGFSADEQTLWCGNVAHDQFVQVTPSGVRLVACSGGQFLADWKPPAGTSVSVASGNGSQVALATGGGHVVYLEVGAGSLQEAGHVELDAEVACLDVSPLTDDGTGRAQLLVVGTWTMQVHILSLPALQPVVKEAIGGEIMPRSLLFARFEGVDYMLCGLGDGHILTYRMEAAGLADKKRLALGTKPITLRTFKSRGTSYVFAASDRPTVIYSSNQKLLFSNLNENEVNFMTSFSPTSFPDSLAIAKEESMTIGTIDEVQKLHIRTVPLHEQPRRISHQAQTKSFAVTTTKTAMAHEEGVTDSVLLLDDQTFEVMHRFKLQQYEMALSATSMSFASDPTLYYVVGTAYALPDEPEPTKGRILVMEARDARLNLVCEKGTHGAVYNVTSFHGKLLAGINGRVQLYDWLSLDDVWQLSPECSHTGHVLALYIDTRGDFIVVGDLMKSMSLLMYKPDEHMLEIRARDYNPCWMSAVSILDDDTYLGAENNYNLFTVRKNGDSATDEERARLEVVGQFHLGEFVNRFRHGSLVMKLPDSEVSKLPMVLFGTISGVIGVIASLPQEQFIFLEKLQASLRKVINGVGGLDHAEWRSFTTPFMPGGASHGFIDGDLIEQFLDLKRPKMEAVVAEIPGTTVEEVQRLVEELSRLH